MLFKYSAPKEWHESSIILNLYFFDKFLILFKSEEKPAKFTTVIIFGRNFLFVFFNFFSNLSTSKLKSNSLISTKSIFAPRCIAGLMLAINVIGVVQTKSSFFNPNDI